MRRRADDGVGRFPRGARARVTVVQHGRVRPTSTDARVGHVATPPVRIVMMHE